MKHCEAQPKRKTRRGVTLIELIIVITTMAIITSLAVTTIFMLLRVEGEGAGSLSEALIESRLARQFRKDVHSAIAAELAEDGALKLQNDDQWIIYKPNEDNVSRMIQTDNEQTKAFDQFFIGKKTAKFVIIKQNTEQSSSNYETVDLVIEKPKDTKGTNKTLGPNNRNHMVRATLAFDRRFLKDQQGGAE